MNILKKLRNPIFAIYASIFMLLFSCSQYEIRNEVVESAFNSELYDAFKKGDVKLFNNNTNNKNSLENTKNFLENNKKILSEINEHYGTEIQIPDNFFHVFLDGNESEIIETSLKNGWLNQDDINLFDELIRNINNNGFESAIGVFKNQTLELNLSDKEFSKKNTFVNILEIIHDENPSLFETDFQRESGPRGQCAYATILFIGAVLGIASCATWIMCAFAVIGLYAATDYMTDSCYKYLPNN
jgi:hypothetical protein